MIKANNMETFKQAVSEMMTIRNRRTRTSDKKIKITSTETDDNITVENLAFNFYVGIGPKRFGKFKEEVWSHKICYNKLANTLTFENPTNTDGEEVNSCYDLGEKEATFVYF